MPTEKEVLEALAGVRDPELGKDIVTLRMVEGVKVEGAKVTFTLNLTTPACPLRTRLEESAKAAVAGITGVKEVEMKTGSVVAATRDYAGSEMLKGVKNIIAVASGKGGVGKSTIAVNLAVALAESGAKVGILDADVYGPNIPLMMGIKSPPLVKDDRIIPPEAYGVKVASLGFFYNEETPVIWRGPLVAGAVRQLLTQVDWGELDYLVCDMPPGCLPAGTMIAMADNTQKPIEEVKVGEFVLSYDGKNLVPRRVLGTFPQGAQQVFRLNTANREIIASGNHPFLHYHRTNSWVRLDQLKVGDRLIVPNCIGGGRPLHLPEINHDERFIHFPIETTEDFMRIVGHFVGDGFLKRQKGRRNPAGIRVCEPREGKFRKTYEELYKKVFNCHIFEDNDGLKFAIASAPLALLFRALDLDHRANQKHVPDWVFTLPLTQRLAFVRGYSEADAHIRHRINVKNLPDWAGRYRTVNIVQDTVSVESTNAKLVRQVHDLAVMSGLRSSNVSTRLRKEQRLPEGRTKAHVTRYTFGFSLKHDGRSFKLSRIRSIEPMGEMETYDLQVDQYPNFVANQMLVHNTGDASLTLAQTVPLGGVIIVTTPQEAALNIAAKALAMFKRLNVPILGVVENMSYFVCPHCLPPNQTVITAEGFKPISEVRVGDKVLTHKGRFMRVTQSHVHEYEGTLVRLTTKSALPPEFQLSVTHDHPILTRHLSRNRGGSVLTEFSWTPAGTLTPAVGNRKTDLIAFPRISECKDMAELEAVADYRGRPKLFKLRVDGDLMAILGYYLAEGYIVKRKKRGQCAVRFTFGSSARELAFASEVVKAGSKLGFRPNLYMGRTGWRVEISSVVLARWIAKEFGTGAARKRVPLWVKLLPPEKLDWLLNPYVNGDGNRGKIEAKITSVSIQLAESIRDIALKLGYMPSITVREGNSDFQGRKVNAKRIFRVGFTFSKRTRSDKDFVYLRIRRTEQVPYKGPVYNLEVEEDNSYCTPFQAVHNCGEKSYVFSSGGGRKIAKERDVEFLGEIPLGLSVREQSDLGVPIVSARPDSPEAQVYKELAFRVAGMISIVAFAKMRG